MNSNMSGKLNILDLPEEVLLNIAQRCLSLQSQEQLHCFDRYNELYDVDAMVASANNLAMTNKRFYNIVQVLTSILFIHMKNCYYYIYN